MNWSRRKPGTMNWSPQKKWSLSECPLSASAIFTKVTLCVLQENQKSDPNRSILAIWSEFGPLVRKQDSLKALLRIKLLSPAGGGGACLGTRVEERQKKMCIEIQIYFLWKQNNHHSVILIRRKFPSSCNSFSMTKISSSCLK